MSKISLFTGVEGFEEFDKMARKVKTKRVHYKTPTYTKVYSNDVIDGNILTDDLTLWGKMTELYSRLANFFPVFFTNVEPSEIGEDYKAYDFGIVRVWDYNYTSEAYTHRGTIYKGQDFKVLEAEVIGSEDLGIQERLFVHESLLEYLEEGYRIEQLNWWLEELVNCFKNGCTVSSLMLALIMEGGKYLKNPPNLSRKEDIMT